MPLNQGPINDNSTTDLESGSHPRRYQGCRCRQDRAEAPLASLVLVSAPALAANARYGALTALPVNQPCMRSGNRNIRINVRDTDDPYHRSKFPRWSHRIRPASLHRINRDESLQARRDRLVAQSIGVGNIDHPQQPDMAEIIFSPDLARDVAGKVVVMTGTILFFCL